VLHLLIQKQSNPAQWTIPAQSGQLGSTTISSPLSQIEYTRRLNTRNATSLLPMVTTTEVCQYNAMMYNKYTHLHAQLRVYTTMAVVRPNSRSRSRSRSRSMSRRVIPLLSGSSTRSSHRVSRRTAATVAAAEGKLVIRGVIALRQLHLRPNLRWVDITANRQSQR
jgi:hypothetical protein